MRIRAVPRRVLKWRRRAALPMACVAVAVVRAAVQPAPEVSEILRRVGEYVAEYERAFSAVVAHEHYVQRARSATEHSARELRSDVALVAVGDGEWALYRDVYQVDGRQVRDRDERLAALFRHPSPDTPVEARRVAEASARYNIGAISRTLNTPTAALVFARAANQPRSTFEAGRRHTIGDIGTIELRFRETAMPRIIFTRDAAAAAGRFWVIPETGAIGHTELRLTSAGASVVLTVTYGRDERLDLWVPLRMDERYDASTGVTSVEASSTCGRPRSSRSRGARRTRTSGNSRCRHR